MGNEFKNFQQNLRTSARGIKLGRKLFTSPKTISSKEITFILKQLGLNIPKDFLITADVAQLIISGNAMVSNFQTLQTAQDASSLYSFANSSANTLKTFTALSEQLGWTDEKTATHVRVGATIAQIVASGGLDAMAWISLALEVGMENQRADMAAKQLATRKAIEWYQGTVSIQTTNLQNALAEMNTGKIGTFGFLTKAAAGSDMLFNNAIIKNPAFAQKFPGLNFLPVMQGIVHAEASEQTWWGENKYAASDINFESIGKMDETNAFYYLFHYIIEPYLSCYLEADEYYRSVNKASIFDASILAIIDGQSKLAGNAQISNTFLKHRLTPLDLGNEETFNNYRPRIQESYISFLKPTSYTIEEANTLEERGAIGALLKSSVVRDHINARFDFNYFPIAPTTLVTDWRELSSFISCMDFLDMVTLDPYYQEKMARFDKRVKLYSAFPRLEAWKAQLDIAYQTSLVRKVNLNSLNNVAYFLNKDPKKLQMFTDYNPDEPATFK